MSHLRDVLTTRGRAFLAAGLTLLVGGFLLGFGDISRVGVLLAALPLLAATITRVRGSSVVVTRSVHPSRLVAGQGARVDVLLRNTAGRRTPIQLAEEHVHRLLGDRSRFVMPPMEPGDIREASYQIHCQVRGRYRLGPLTLRADDPYGLATSSALLPGTSDLLVLPRVEILGEAHPRGSGIGTEGALPHLVAQHGEDDAAVRSYRDGDDLRRIHWPATAHRSELMVRQEDHPARRRAVIVLDSRTAGHQGSETAGSFEWAVTAAASIAAHLSGHRYALHLVSEETTTEGIANQSLEIDGALASLATARLGPAWQFDNVLHCAEPLSAAGGLAIAIVTDHDEAVLRQVAALRQPGGTGLMFLLDCASFAQPTPGGPTHQASALAGMVTAAGWSTCVVTSAMTVAQAWSIVSAGSAVNLGAAG